MDSIKPATLALMLAGAATAGSISTAALVREAQNAATYSNHHAEITRPFLEDGSLGEVTLSMCSDASLVTKADGLKRTDIGCRPCVPTKAQLAAIAVILDDTSCAETAP